MLYEVITEYLKIKKEMEEESKKEQNIIFYKLKEEAKKENIFINDTTVGITIRNNFV